MKRAQRHSGVVVSWCVPLWYKQAGNAKIIGKFSTVLAGSIKQNQQGPERLIHGE